MADSNQVASQPVYSSPRIKLTGAVTRNRTLTLPTATDAAAYIRYIDNTCTSINDASNGPAAVVVTVGSGTTVAIPNGSKCSVLIDSRGVSRLTTSSNIETRVTTNVDGQNRHYLSDAEINSRVIHLTGTTLGAPDEDFPSWFPGVSQGMMIYGPIPQDPKDIIRTTIHCDGFDSNNAFGLQGIYNGVIPDPLDSFNVPVLVTYGSFTIVAEILWTSDGPILVARS